MSLRLAHTFAVAATVTLAVLSVLTGGALPGWAWLFALAPAVWPAVHHVAPPLAERTASVLAAVGLVVPLVWWWLAGTGETGMVAACLALLTVLSVRQASRTLPSHDLQALVLALLLICVGAMLNPTPSYAALLVPFATCAVAALVTRQLVHDVAMAAFRDGDLAAADAQLDRRDVITGRFVVAVVGLSVVLLGMAGALFAAFPRVGLPAFATAGIHGLPPKVALGPTPWGLGNAQVAARVWGLGRRGYERGLYLRGLSYDVVDGNGFARSGRPAPIRPLAGDGPEVSYAVVQQAAEGDPLLALGPLTHGVVSTSDNHEAKIVHVQGGEEPAYTVTTAGSHRGQLTGPMALWRPSAPQQPSSATAMQQPLLPAQSSSVPATQQPSQNATRRPLPAKDAAFAAHYLGLPQDLRARLLPLVHQAVAAPADFPQTAAMLRHFLAQSFTYAVDDAEPVGGEEDGPLLAFLLRHRRGNCTYFASAYAALLRAAGIPSRVVGGFEGGRWDGDEAVVTFTGAHAHAWVEWYLPEVGWVVDDATPPRAPEVVSGWALWRERMGRFWQLDVLEFSLANQRDMVRHAQAQWLALGHLVFPGRVGAIAATPPSWRGAGLGLAGAVLGALVLGYGWRRRRRRPQQQLHQALQQALTAALGRPLRPDETFRAALAALMAPPKNVLPGQPAKAQAILPVVTPTQHAALTRACQVHEACLYGRLPLPADWPQLIVGLRQRRP